ncbi:MAG: hypothetical protein JWQ71_92 [Pedosphaera sp.]|nr:hypothetical protein [Pedosphaera sp.]
MRNHLAYMQNDSTNPNLPATFSQNPTGRTESRPATSTHLHTMATKYERLIGDYCTKHGIVVPPGFARLTPSRYAIIRTHLAPPKLIAKTWFKTADVHYYIEHFLQPELGDTLSESIRILDFQQGQELTYTGGKRLNKVGTFPIAEE